MTTQSKYSKEAVLSELDLFTIPPVQKSIERSYEVQYRPISSLDSTKIIEFSIPTSKDEYILLHETYFYVKIQLKIRKADDSALTIQDWETVTPVNNLLHSMIKQVELEIGGKEVTMSNSTYAYRAYIENMLGFSADAKNSHLSSCLWMENAIRRRSFFTPRSFADGSSKEVDLYGRLHFDMTFQGKAILGGKDIKDRVSDVAMVIKDACLYVHKMKATPQLTNAHSKALAIAPACYPISRVDLRQASIHANSLDAVLDNIITGQLPRRLFLLMVKNTAFNGSKSQDPFHFDHFNVSHAACYVDGVQFPTNAYQPDFKNQLCVREYSGLFQAMNMNSTDTTVNITREDFMGGKTIFAFNFAPDLSHGPGMTGHINPIKRGSLRVQLRFSEPLRETITVLLYCEFDNIIEIDLERNAVTDFK
ncbi:uncharacterized protein F54H12.2-like [Panonychus citri]|uniref:uncharacterized protein F54H12.2-like n=1 Tax=Panonychus citri TaxID=50023 RepID=UPI00230808CD|nr:uncharacterized protein F54H12.2-like [Panonychus citri]